MHPLLRPPAPLPPSLPPPPERTLLADGALPAARVAAPAPTARQACAAAAGAAGASGAGGLGRAGGGGAGGGVHLLPPKMQLGIWQYHNDGDLGGNWVVPSLSVCVGGVGERWATGWWAAASKPRGAPPPPTHQMQRARTSKQPSKHASLHKRSPSPSRRRCASASATAAASCSRCRVDRRCIHSDTAAPATVITTSRNENTPTVTYLHMRVRAECRGGVGVWGGARVKRREGSSPRVRSLSSAPATLTTHHRSLTCGGP